MKTKTKLAAGYACLNCGYYNHNQSGMTVKSGVRAGAYKIRGNPGN